MTDMKASYTLIAFGTGESYQMPKKNFLTQFFDYCMGTEDEDKSYLDGPSLLGLEVKPNAKEGHRRIIAWLEGKTDQEDLIVNLAGFSRGAVTCIHIANRLNRHKKELEAIPEEKRSDAQKSLLAKFERLQLNLFVVDPVAGYTAKATEEARVIPEIVSNYVSILQLDEGRRDFKPQDNTRIIVENPRSTRVAMLPLYGHHSASIKDKGKGMDSAAQIVWSALHSFLSHNGSEYAEIPSMVNSNTKDEIDVKEKSNEALCDDFARHHAQRDNYAAESKKVILTDSLPTVRVPRKMNQHVELYVRDSDFFVNKLERELFKITYPKTFNYLFEGNKKDPRFPGASGSSKEDVHEEINRIKEKSPELYQYLMAKGKIDENGHLISMTPEGSAVLESLSTVEMIYPDRFAELNLNGYDKELCNKELNELEVLTQSIYRLTFQYQREKSVFDIFRKKTEDARAEQIRKEVLAVVKKGGDVPVIKDDILTIIYDHAVSLRLSGSNSELLVILDKVLVDNGCGSTAALENEGTLQLIRAGFNLVDEVIYFAATGGYIGGAVLSVAGTLLEDIGNRIIGLSKSTQKDESKEVNSLPRERVLSKIGEAFVAIGSAFKAHFGVKSVREDIRSKISEMRDSFFSRKLIPENSLLKAVKSSAHADRRLGAINEALKKLGAVNGDSPLEVIKKYNQLEIEKEALEHKGFYLAVTPGQLGPITVPTYQSPVVGSSSPASPAA